MTNLFQITLLAIFLLLASPFVFLTGCETIRSATDRVTEVVEKNPLIAKTAVQYGVLRFIDGDPDRAEAVNAFLDTSRSFLDSDTVTRVSDLSDSLKERIDWSSLSTANALLLNTLFDTVQRYITLQVEGEDLSPEAVVTIHAVFLWVEDAAALSRLGVYAPE